MVIHFYLVILHFLQSIFFLFESINFDCSLYTRLKMKKKRTKNIVNIALKFEMLLPVDGKLMIRSLMFILWKLQKYANKIFIGSNRLGWFVQLLISFFFAISFVLFQLLSVFILFNLIFEMVIFCLMGSVLFILFLGIKIQCFD